MSNKYIIYNNEKMLTTKILEENKNKFNNDIIYIPRYDRKILITKDQMLQIDIIFKLEYGKSLREFIEYSLDLFDPFSYEKIEKGMYINCGYMQIFNIVYSYVFYKPKIFIIDKFEQSLHPLVAYGLLQIIYDLSKNDECLLFFTFDFLYKKNNNYKYINYDTFEKILKNTLQ